MLKTNPKKVYLMASLAVIVLAAGAFFAINGNRFFADMVLPVESPGTGSALDKSCLSSSDLKLGLTWQMRKSAKAEIYVRSTSGSKIVTIYDNGSFMNRVGAGDYKTVWNGTIGTGKAIAVGNYKIIFEYAGNYREVHDIKVVQDSASCGTVTPTDPTTVDPTVPEVALPNELGLVAEGSARANYDWFRNGSSNKFGTIFKATKTGAVTKFALPWKTWKYQKPDGTWAYYGKGNFGIWTFELRKDNGGMPGDLIKNVTGVRTTDSMYNGNGDWINIPISADLQVGSVYHLIAINTDPNPSANYSSVNTIMTRKLAWPQNLDVAPRAECTTNGTTWTPWASTSVGGWFTATTNNDNAAIVPMLITWQDSSVTGFVYTSNETSGYNLSQNLGQTIAWKDVNTTVSQVGIFVNGVDGANVTFELYDGATKVSSGTLAADSASRSNKMVWYRGTAAGGSFALQQGKTYKLYFKGPSSIVVYPFYDPNNTYGSGYFKYTWGGTDSRFFVTGRTTDFSSYDLPFSLKRTQ